jgi:hypothetical protein
MRYLLLVKFRNPDEQLNSTDGWAIAGTTSSEDKLDEWRSESTAAIQENVLDAFMVVDTTLRVAPRGVPL